MNQLLRLFFILAGTSLFASPPAHTLTLTNPAEVARPDEPIVISRKTLESLTSKIPAGMVPRLKNSKGIVLPSQADETTGDVEWDELAFLYSFKPREKVQIQVEYMNPQQMPTFPLRAYAFLGYSPERNNIFFPVRMETLRKEHKPQVYPNTYQLEGPCWESDKVGFRLYFDKRNGKDIFGKTKPEMVLERIKPKEDYHSKQAWGMDVLKVNASLGAGALAILDKTSGKMARLGENTDSTAFELIAKGPVRAVFRLRYTGWKVGSDTYDLTEEITIWGGSYGYESNVTLTGFTGERNLVTGIVNLYSDQSLQKKQNDQYTTLATHAKQSENKDYLGMALLLKNSELIKTGEAPEEGEGITQTYYAQLKARPNVPLTFRFYAGWEGSDPKFKEQAFFLKLLQQEADRLSQPIKVTK